MDIRKPVLGILVGGSPAPGVNGVICSVTLEAINKGCEVVGIYEGYKRLREGKSKTISFKVQDVTRIQTKGGSILRTSKMQLTSPQETDNVLRVLEHLRVRYLVTIGGTATAYSTTLVAAAAKAAKFKLSVVHVPKTIFNDLPLPENSRTFGFTTARQVGCSLVQMFSQDAATMVRWYILTCVGVNSGHLTLGIGKAAAAHITIIPEEFPKGKKVVFSELVDIIEAGIYKRRVNENNYGIVVLCEGLVDLMDEKEVKEKWGDLDSGHQDLGRHIVAELQARFKKTGLVITTVARNIGTECRAADPSAADILLSRDLGFGATRFLLDGGTGCMITIKSGSIYPVPLTDLIDPKTGKCAIRQVDISKIAFQVAQNYMIKLKKSDLEDKAFLQKVAHAASMSIEQFVERYKYIAVAST